MSLTRSLLLLVLLASVSLVIVTAINCTRPYTPLECQAIKFACPDVDEERCQKSGKTFLPGGGTCGYCDICAKFMGYHEPCNITTKENLDSGETVDVTIVCEEQLICTQRNDGICVPEDRCIYNN